MRIQNLKTPEPSPMASPVPPLSVAQNAASAAQPNDAAPAGSPSGSSSGSPNSPVEHRQALEIALLKARIQHLELVVETARCLMGSNQERLLRRLHEVPRELVELTAQLRRVDPTAAL